MKFAIRKGPCGTETYCRDETDPIEQTGDPDFVYNRVLDLCRVSEFIGARAYWDPGLVWTWAYLDLGQFGPGPIWIWSYLDPAPLKDKLGEIPTSH